MQTQPTIELTTYPSVVHSFELAEQIAVKFEHQVTQSTVLQTRMVTSDAMGPLALLLMNSNLIQQTSAGTFPSAQARVRS